ncbi:MAG: AbrB/MazE/SpoVT family DNA-binding domain-containing protein [Chloroflexota bacterium]
MDVTTLSSRGQVVLPKAVRERLGLVDGQRLAVEVIGDHVLLRPVGEQHPPGASAAPRQQGWQSLRGCLMGTNALADLMADHRREVEHGR